MLIWNAGFEIQLPPQTVHSGYFCWLILPHCCQGPHCQLCRSGDTVCGPLGLGWVQQWEALAEPREGREWRPGAFPAPSLSQLDSGLEVLGLNRASCNSALSPGSSSSSCSFWSKAGKGLCRWQLGSAPLAFASATGRFGGVKCVTCKVSFWKRTQTSRLEHTALEEVMWAKNSEV